MDIYLVRNLNGQYLWEHEGVVSWGSREAAWIYGNRESAEDAGKVALGWAKDALEKFEIVHLVATAKVDKSQYPKTLDGVAIELGKTYYRFDRDGVCDVYVYELTVQLSRDGDIEYLKVREGVNKVWVYSDDLYQSERAAWKVWGETKWD